MLGVLRGLGRSRLATSLFWIALLLGAVLFGLCVFGALMISLYGALTRDFGWVVAWRDGK